MIFLNSEGSHIPRYIMTHHDLLCIVLRDLLLREIYDKFSEDPVGKVVFLESLEPHILSDK